MTARVLAVASLVAAILVGLGVATGRTAESSLGVERAAVHDPAAEATAATEFDATEFDATEFDATEIDATVASSSEATEAGFVDMWSIQGILDRLLRGTASIGDSAGLANGTDASHLAEIPAAVSRTASIGAAVRTFDGRPLRAVRTMSMVVTAYSPDERSCGASADGITASGYSVHVNGGCLVAADPKVLPLGSLVSVPGYDGGAVVPVLDTGGAIKGQRLDVLFPTHREALGWGKRVVEVTVWEYDDGKPSGFKRVRRKDRGGV